jgi:YVTN family beta-propeller protein
MRRLLARAVLLACSSLALAAPAMASHPLTPAGWAINPAGTEFGVDQTASGFVGPLGAALSPDGTQLLTASSGAARIDSADLWDLGSQTRADYVPYDGYKGSAIFYGVVFSPDGTHAWASGGGQNVVHTYTVTGNHLTAGIDIPTPYFPAGLAYGHTPKGDRIYVANNLSAPANGSTNPAGHRVTVIDPASNTVTGTIDLGNSLEPLGVAFDRQGDKAYVTNQLGRSVSVLDTNTETKLSDITLSPLTNPLQADHPGAITANPARDEVYVANADSDTVSVIDTRTDSLLATIDVSLLPGPKGGTPDGLAVSPDGSTLYVALAGENAVAVVNLDTRSVEGFIPTAWYPTAVSVTPDGKRLVITNDRGSGAGPNPCGPLSALQKTPQCPPLDPNRDQVPKGKDGASDPQYTGSMIKGSVTVVDVPAGHELRHLTRRVDRNNQVDARRRAMPFGAHRIKHVIYIIKENRTYDQIFGSLGKGNGDPSLNLFGNDSAPNTRELARRFTTLDNFYANAEVSADGHNWADQAQANQYTEMGWPINYSPSPRSSQRSYDFEQAPTSELFASEPLQGDPSIARGPAANPVGYLWDAAYNAGVSFRDYGESTPVPGFCTGNGNTSNTTHLDPRFGDHVDGSYPGYNTSCSDHTQRLPEWQREFRAFEKSGNLPSLEIVRLPNDHTAGTGAGRPTPQAMVADNDVALGRMVQDISHSQYWKDTLIVVTEDDAQDGPDHVDAHRTEALAISPYTQAGKVDSTHYDTASMVATIESILGLQPMSIFDSRASRLWGSFTGDPSFKPYDTLQPSVIPFGDPGSPVNTPASPMASQSARWSFRREDLAPEIGLNQAIWQSVRGKGSRMPAPRHGLIYGAGSSLG